MSFFANWERQFELSWFRQKYEVALFVVREETIPIHDWSAWKRIAPIVDQILRMTDEKAAIRSSQCRSDHKGWLAFGRMIWSEQNNRKWCTKYFTGKYGDGLTEFWDTEIWAPDWNAAWKHRKPIDVLVKLDRGNEKSTIDQGLIVALREEIFLKRSTGFDRLCSEIKDQLPKSASYLRTNRDWAEEYYEDGYSNGLSDASASHLVKLLVN